MDSDKAKQKETEDWIVHIVDTINQYYAGRQVVLWGKYKASDNIRNKLKEKYGVEIAFYVDSDSKKIDNKQVFSADCLDGKSSEYYVVIPLAFYPSIKEKMIGGGYKNKIDYYYFSDCAVCQKDDYYEDAHGNKIIGGYQGLKFAFSGFGAAIQIGENVHFHDTSIYVHNHSKIVIGNESYFQNCKIFIEQGTKLEFGREVNLQESDIWIGEYADILVEKNVKIRGMQLFKTRWNISDNVRLKIGSQSILFYGYLYMAENSLLQIGREFSIGEGYHVALDRYTSITIGDDCMFSNDILLRCGDGHSIFDVVSGENINSTDEISKNRNIEIGSHVWVGMRAAVLYYTKIGDGSIVGAMSLVKGILPNNCIAAGVPAKVMRKDVSWSRENGTDNISECGYQYVNKTK